MTALLFVVFLGAAFLYSGLDAAWRALDPVRLRHRADGGNRQARRMLAWMDASPQLDLVLSWSSHACAAAAVVSLAEGSSGAGFPWAAALGFLFIYALIVRLLSRQVFRRMPFGVLGKFWWLVVPTASFWAALARPSARLLRRVPSDPLPRAPAEEELMGLSERTEGISPLERGMLRSVMGFRRLAAGDLAQPVASFPHAGADRTLSELLADRKLAEARHLFVLGADGLPLGAMSCGMAALSGALAARAQSFARPLVSVSSDLPAWKTLERLRRSQTPVAEVRDAATGEHVGVITDASACALLLGQAV